jgi:hypothetical protein
VLLDLLSCALQAVVFVAVCRGFVQHHYSQLQAAVCMLTEVTHRNGTDVLQHVVLLELLSCGCRLLCSAAGVCASCQDQPGRYSLVSLTDLTHLNRYTDVY